MKGLDSTTQGAFNWTFTREGAAIHAREGVAVIADVHLGYEWARASGGDQLPAHSLRETIEKLTSVFNRYPLKRLIVAGDLVESASPCIKTSRDVSALAGWLRERSIELIALQGNHDPARIPPRASTANVDGWTIGHGHQRIPGDRIMFGHHHPIFRAQGATTACFLVGPSCIVLPAFSPNAAGWNIAGVTPKMFRGRSLRCLVPVENEVLDFGEIETLAERISAKTFNATG
jgi:putative SbcD/Mre11-related phosphoesterase